MESSDAARIITTWQMVRPCPIYLRMRASFWDDETLVREEITYLPDDTYVLETNEFNVGEDGKLIYKLIVDKQDDADG